MSSYGVAGTDPIADLSARAHILLMNAIKTRWNLIVHGNITPPIPFPAEADIFFLPTWTTGARDVELIFKEEFVDMPSNLRSVDWRLQGHTATVNIHIFVRGRAGDTEPPLLGQVISGIEKIVVLNKTSLIPNAWCEITAVMPGPLDREDDIQTHYHSIIKVKIHYWKVVV